MKKEPEEVLVNVFEVAPAGSLVLNELTKKADEVLQEAVQQYCLVSTTAFEKIVEEQQEAQAEVVT